MNLPDARTVLSRAAAALATTPDPAEPSALPSQVAAFLRWGITALGATLVAHHVLSAARSNEIAVAEKKMPPELAPFASSFASFLDSEDAAARAAADAKLQQIAAARAVVAG